MATQKQQQQRQVAHSDGSLINRLLAGFEAAREVDENGKEYWSARRYAEILRYTWRRFEAAIERGKAALAQEGGTVSDHFDDVVKMISLGKGAERDIGDIRLTRCACYLVGINGDPRKKDTIAAVQRYFVEQTRKREILEQVTADADRLQAHGRLAEYRSELRLEAGSRSVDDHGFTTIGSRQPPGASARQECTR